MNSDKISHNSHEKLTNFIFFEICTLQERSQAMFLFRHKHKRTCFLLRRVFLSSRKMYKNNRSAPARWHNPYQLSRFVQASKSQVNLNSYRERSQSSAKLIVKVCASERDVSSLTITPRAQPNLSEANCQLSTVNCQLNHSTHCPIPRCEAMKAPPTRRLPT